MRQVILSVSFADTFRATLTSGLLVLGSLVILQTQLISSASAEVTFLNKWGSYGTGDGQFYLPSDVALSDTGQVYVTDRSNSRVQRFDADGNYETQWGSYGSGDGEFYYPSSIAITHTGQVYVADSNNHRIQRFFDSEAWDHGTNTFVNGGAGPTSVAVGPGDILGSSLTLNASKGLVVGDTTTVNTGGTLSISGGSLTTGSFDNNGSGALNIDDGGLVTVSGTTTIGDASTATLADGSFEFGQTTMTEFSRINATAGSLAGNVNITEVNDVASMTALQNSAVDMSGVVAVNNGLLYGSAILNSSLDNQSGGELRVASSDWIRFEGPNNINRGDINNFGGQIDFAQDVTNDSGGFIGGRDTFFRFGDGLTNAGEIGLSVGLHDILGSIVNTATGRIMVAGQSTATFYGDVANDGDIFTGQGSQSVFFGDVTGSGSFPGTGIVEFAGSISPGNSPGEVSFGGDVVLGATTTPLPSWNFRVLTLANTTAYWWQECWKCLAHWRSNCSTALPRSMTPHSKYSLPRTCPVSFHRCCCPTCRAI